MSRHSRYDTDEERLPEGMTRVGYDADTQVYTFQDADGSYWESAPGCQYGQLTRVSDGNDATDAEPFVPGGTDGTSQTSWRTDMRPLLNFGFLVGLFLLVLFWFLHYTASTTSKGVDQSGPRKHNNDVDAVLECPGPTSPYTILEHDTCWGIGVKFGGIPAEQLRRDNPMMDCDRLLVGSLICVPMH